MKRSGVLLTAFCRQCGRRFSTGIRTDPEVPYRVKGWNRCCPYCGAEQPLNTDDLQPMPILPWPAGVRRLALQPLRAIEPFAISRVSRRSTDARTPAEPRTRVSSAGGSASRRPFANAASTSGLT